MIQEHEPDPEIQVTAENESEVARQAKLGNKAAMAALNEAYYGRLHKYFVFHGAGSEARDLNQNVWLRVIKYWPRTRDDVVFRAFLFMQALHVWSKWFRSRHRTMLSQPNSVLDRRVRDTGDRELRERVAHLRQAMSSLSSREQNVLYLHGEGLRGRELAYALRTSRAGVHRMFSAARRKLRKYL